MAPALLPSLRRMVFGKAWYDRCAKESPSITNKGRPDSVGRGVLAARLRRPTLLPAGWVDLLLCGKAVALAGATWPLVCRVEGIRGFAASRNFTHTGAWSLAPSIPRAW